MNYIINTVAVSADLSAQSTKLLSRQLSLNFFGRTDTEDELELQSQLKKSNVEFGFSFLLLIFLLGT